MSTNANQFPSSRITVEEICRRLPASKTTVYGLLECGSIPAIRRGRNWLIPRYGYMQWEKDFGQKPAEVRAS